MREGKVKWYNGKKCFGFITPTTANESGNKDDVFVHSSALKDADIRFLNENDVVKFEEEVRNGKLSVTSIELIKRDEESAKKFQEDRGSRGGFGGNRDRDSRGSDDRGSRGGFGGNRDRDSRGGNDDKKSGFSFWKK